MNRTATLSTTAAEPSTEVSSLRAAALSTLRLNRRRQLEQATFIPVRPPPPGDTFQLDYGTEDTSQNVSMKDVSTSLPAPSETEISRSSLDQQLAREEGEISEEEEPLLPSKYLPANNRSSSRIKVTSSPKPPTHELVHPSQLRLDQASPKQSSDMGVGHVDYVHRFSMRISSSDIQTQDPVRAKLLSVGPNCVRPGLPCEQSRFAISVCVHIFLEQ